MSPVKVVKNEEYERVALEVINSSRVFLHISVLKASLTKRPASEGCIELYHATRQARQRGVAVLFMLSIKSLTATRDVGNEIFAKRLKVVGIPVRHCEGRRICHAKMIIADDKVALVGSHNWTLAALRRNFECSLLVSDPEVVKELDEFYQKEFNLGRDF